jgi:hypothetical protein
MRPALLGLTILGVLLAPRPSDACVQHPETNKLLGWAADGSAALHVRIEDGKLIHAEIQPTRYEGFKTFIGVDGSDGKIHIKQVAINKCDAFVTAATDARADGPLTEATLAALPIVQAMKLVDVPTDDGGASNLTAGFVPRKRYAEHQVRIKDGKKVVATLPVPVWCTGSCLRDEAFKQWTATVTTVAKAGDRTLYVVRMTGVCNGANDKALWMDRVIAAPGAEKRPPRRRCRGSGE